jgi:hypothetical protein
MKVIGYLGKREYVIVTDDPAKLAAFAARMDRTEYLHAAGGGQ